MSKLTVFIDEAGDPGVRDGLRFTNTRHEWLCTSAVVVRTEREPLVVDWVRELREIARSRQAGVLHYHRITKERREGVCAALGSKPIRAFVMASHKSNLRHYINQRIQKQMDDGTFYNWCLRLLLERLTAWASELMAKEGRAAEPLRLIFAERGGHDYNHLFSYVDLLRMQKEQATLFLKGPGLAEPTLDRTEWAVVPATAAAGLQLADVVASAFYQAANSASPAFDLAPAKALAPIVPTSRIGKHANVGLTVFPLPHQAPLPDAARGIFEFYDYVF